MLSKSRFRSLYVLWLILIVFWTITRTLLLVKSWPNLDVTPLLLAKIYLVGFLFDCVTFSYAAIPFAAVSVLLPDRVVAAKPFRAIAALILFLVSYLMLFGVVAEYVFFDEFATRFNFIAIDYLIYTDEVIRNIRQSYPVTKILAALFFINIPVFLCFRRSLDASLCTVSRLGKRIRVGLPVLLLPICSLLFIDISRTHISKNNYADELAGNGIYNLFAAFRNNDLEFKKFYAQKDDRIVLERLRRLIAEKGSRLVSDDGNSVERVIAHQGQEKRLNVVVIVEESLSANFLGVYGIRTAQSAAALGAHGIRTGLTPNLDKLASESLFFTHLYATGTRTVRGLEAITLAIPPLPGSSIIKRPNNENLVSWGSVMNEKGYDNKFIYGGHGYFDNMNYFFENNGFATIDRMDFDGDEVTFENAWGVCDEDLFRKVIRECDKSSGLGKPFFTIVMTTSNHRPYTFPAGKIDIPSKTGGRDGAVKYADYAVGRLLEEGKSHGWFKDTVFVIAADHCASSARKMALPIKDYEIPLFIYAPSLVKPQRIDTIMSQIDIAPTVLGLLNFNYTSTFLGKDILNEDGRKGRAFISTYQKLGFIEDDKLLVLGPKKEVSFYSFERWNGKTTEIEPDEDVLLDGMSYYQGADYIYQHRLNRLSSLRNQSKSSASVAPHPPGKL